MIKVDACLNDQTARLATDELQKYVNRCKMTGWAEAQYTLVTEQQGESFSQSYSWHIEAEAEPIRITMKATDSAAMLYAVYSFAEQFLGVRYTMEGDVFEQPASVPIKNMLHQASCSFAIRGTLPWHNFLCGPSGWNEQDYFQYVEQLAKLRCNFVMFHVYTGGLERYWPYVEPLLKIEWMGVTPEAQFDTSATARWGNVPRSTLAFSAEAKPYFPDEVFGSDLTLTAQNKEQHYTKAADMFRRLLNYAHERGIKVGLGFEPGIVPPEIHSLIPAEARLSNLVLDPFHPASQEILGNTIKYIAVQYSDLDYVVLWQHEHAIMDHHIPRPDTLFEEYCNKHEQQFSYLERYDRRMDGCWSLAMFEQAHALLTRYMPQVKTVVSGWGGDMQFPQMLRGLSGVLDENIIFSCLAPNLGEIDGPKELLELKDRKYWIIPWFEGDHQLWHPQPRLHSLDQQIHQAKLLGADGVIAIHWRIKEIQDQFSYMDKRLWSQTYTPLQHYNEIWGRECANLPAEVLQQVIAVDSDYWFKGVQSMEFYGFHSLWGRLTDECYTKVNALQQQLSNQPLERGSRLQQLNQMLKLALELHHLSEQFEQIENLRSACLGYETSHAALDAEEEAKQVARIQEALSLIASCQVEACIQHYVDKLSPVTQGPSYRGELGVLSSMNQRLYGYLESLQSYFEGLKSS
ncbi:hypothetical protein ACFQZR_09810 [Paenibacillus sp. GCM10027629]|uniref:hypothetical protein n=1 Tax=Paenibacillus sp. GCM10027629 TaxID=3273414 RepID=UPI00363ACC8C